MHSIVDFHTILGLIIDYRRQSLKWIEILLDPSRSNPSFLDIGGRTNEVLLDSEALEDGGRVRGVLELVLNHIDRLMIFTLAGSFYVSDCFRCQHLTSSNEFMHVLFHGAAGHFAEHQVSPLGCCSRQNPRQRPRKE